MDFIAEEELCEQAYEVWLHYACPACEDSAPRFKPRSTARQPTSSCDGPCSVLPPASFFFAADGKAGRSCVTRQ